MSDGDSPTSESESGVLVRSLRTIVPNAIRRRFALKFVIVLLIMGSAIGALGAAATAEITEQTEDRVETEYSSLANQEANLVSQFVSESRTSTRLVSDKEVWTIDNTTRMSEELRENTDSQMPGSVSAVRVYNRTGDDYSLVASSLRDDLPIGESEREWVTDVEFGGQDDVRISSVYETQSGPVIGVASPTAADDRYVVAEFATSSLVSQFQGQENADGGFTLVVDENGDVVMDENSSVMLTSDTRLFTEYADERPLREADRLVDQPSDVLSSRPANADVIDEEYAVGYSLISIPERDGDWYALVHAPTSELFGSVQTVSQYGGLVTIAGVLLIVVIGAVLGYNTSRSIDRLTGKAEEMEDGNLDVDVSSGRIDNIGRLYDGFANMRDSLKEQISEAERARKEAEVSRAEAMEMNTYLQEKAEEYSGIMQACARGDLTRRLESEGENEAMDQIARDFNEMITELEMTTGQLKTFALEVEESGRSVQQSAETVRDASEQMADSVQKISDDAYDQKERLRRISEEMDAVADQLEAFANDHPDVDFGDSLDSIQAVANMVDEAATLGEETMDESENVAGAAEEQAAELNEVSSHAEELTRYAEYLGDGLNNFETEEEHEFVFQTGAGGAGPGAAPGEGGSPESDASDGS